MLNTPPDEKLLDSHHEELLPPEPPELEAPHAPAASALTRHNPSTPLFAKVIIAFLVFMDIVIILRIFKVI